MKHDLYIQTLKTDPKAAITVVNDLSSKNIVCNATGSFLISKYGSIEDFFNSLGDAGIKSVTVFLKRKNGTNYIPAKDAAGDPEFYSFDFTDMDQQPEEHNEPVNRSSNRSQRNDHFTGMNGGMNAPENVYKVMHFPKIENELERANTRIKELEKEIKVLEDNAMLEKIRKASGDGTNDTISTIMEKAPGVLTALKGLMNKGAASAAQPIAEMGLGTPAAAMSEIKLRMIQYIQGNDDDTAGYLLCLVSGFGNETFEEELDEVLKKFNLIAA